MRKHAPALYEDAGAEREDRSPARIGPLGGEDAPAQVARLRKVAHHAHAAADEAGGGRNAAKGRGSGPAVVAVGTSGSSHASDARTAGIRCGTPGGKGRAGAEAGRRRGLGGEDGIVGAAFRDERAQVRVRGGVEGAEELVLLEPERVARAVEPAGARKVRAEREEEYRKLVEEEKKSKEDMKRLAKTEKQYRADLAAKKKEVDRLNKEIQKLLKSTVAAQKKDKTQVDVALSSEFAKNKGKLPWPLKQGVITERFGVHNHPVYTNLKLPDNPGITFSTTRGADVYCVFDGEVRKIIVMPGYNQCILVQHGEYFTLYCKIGKVSVKSGQKVKTGDKLGTLEIDGNTSSLHFQLWKGTDKQNPESWLRK